MAPIPLTNTVIASLALTSALWGIFFLLSIASTYYLLSRRRETAHGDLQSRKTEKRLGLLLVASGCIFTFVTGHWIMTIYIFFHAFAIYEGGTNPMGYYTHAGERAEGAQTAFLLATLITVDAILIYRLWMVWNRHFLVIVLPCMSLVGLIVTGGFQTYEFASASIAGNEFDPVVARWILAVCSFILTTNVYCTTMIVYRIWSTKRDTVKAGSIGENSVYAVHTFIESSAIYAIWTIFYFIVYAAGSNLNAMGTDCHAIVAGISFMLNNARVGFARDRSDRREQQQLADIAPSMHFSAVFPPDSVSEDVSIGSRRLR
ncbi:hypothetical protein CONPUDRAFT_135893 [Coniophora puteana RWD-64-598 SS2]|uniref:Family A G protein-coupled receptor-like protein n=1 Tax=Coniophora puteana (strain RWD-64-598) TaxID=741705 RepID=A0A5M3MZB3_CONPW|nr:uncharacterized protein CONPUDRAFT_135893 [Coniophora puteana RWD-64-598 SS2]EIW84490.1 hypothetical protein CONPUDRAFT_135893 [Coniophora puteana RWD-64-598 SS2]